MERSRESIEGETAGYLAQPDDEPAPADWSDAEPRAPSDPEKWEAIKKNAPAYGRIVDGSRHPDGQQCYPGRSIAPALIAASISSQPLEGRARRASSP